MSSTATTTTTLIGAPTLISSTFNSSNTTSLTPTNAIMNTAGGGSGLGTTGSSSQSALTAAMMVVSMDAAGICGGASSSDDTDSQTEGGGGGGITGGGSVSAIATQLNFQLLPLTGGMMTSSIASTSGGGLAAALDTNSIMNSSQISTTSNDSVGNMGCGSGMGLTNGPGVGGGGKLCGSGKHLTAHSVAGKSCRFPKLEECAHFHYERVQLGPLSVRLADDKSELLNSSSIASQSIGGGGGGGLGSTLNGPANNDNDASSQTGAPTGASSSSSRPFTPFSCWFIIKVSPHRCEPFLVKRSFDNMQMFDEMLHRCVYDRKISGLKNLQADAADFKCEEDVEYAVAKYLERFSKIASDSLTCGTILTWLQLDNKGRRLPLADGDTMRSINTPAVGAAYGVRRYQAQASDEISIEVGDMISVIDMPSPAESVWWRGKKSHLQKSHYEVGFFPQSCVATIGDKVPRHFRVPAPLMGSGLAGVGVGGAALPPLVGQLDVSPTKPVLRKHGKLIAFFRSFILSRPSRRRLKQSGIYRERVFSCDLSEHLLNSGLEIPMVLSCCAEFIEKYGIIDGIYRLSGITSNIQKLRSAFDEERVPDLGNPEMKQDIHAVSSLLKMYFRELPNPLCTYQLYDNFVEAIQEKSESSERLRLMKQTVLKLPPPHYRTLKYLAEHLHKISQHAERTGMTDKNLAIVWAPNLLRSPALEMGGVAALRGVGVQAVVTEYLIRNCHNIFDALDDPNARFSYIGTAGAMTSHGGGAAGGGSAGGGGGSGAGGGTGGGGVGVVGGSTAESRLDSLTDCESLLVEQREHDQSSLLFVAERPKSLSAGGPKLISLEEAQERHSRLDGFDIKQSMPINMVASSNAATNIGAYIEVGGGPSSLPDKYHTVLSAPRSWQKRKTHSWKSLFTRNQRASVGGTSGASGGVSLSVGGHGSGDVHLRHHHHPADHKMGLSQSVDVDDCVRLVNAMARRKDGSSGAQVTFAESDAIIGGGKSKPPEKTKSIELFETSRGGLSGGGDKPMFEACIRSNSIDSLRTAAGHSRSVSHDSYFDLLQSPQRGHMTTCPSRELSELGLNFDREEPEMRLFSESESLVSSPRVGKENIPPQSATSSAATSRRILRARPEEFSSQTNSVNPSPKKQPRLNLLLSPSAARDAGAAAAAAAAAGAASAPAHTHETTAGHLSSDESCCKRYKLEDQLSDIQYIDCGTPEHTVAGAPVVVGGGQQTLYASVQVHSPPSGLGGKMTPDVAPTNAKALKAAQAPTAAANGSSPSTTTSGMATRYSYPTVQLGAKRKEQDAAAAAAAGLAASGGSVASAPIKERFSYPGTSNTPTPTNSAPSLEQRRYEAKENMTPSVDAASIGAPVAAGRTTAYNRTVSFTQPTQQQHPSHHHHHNNMPLNKVLPDLLRPKNRSSYCGPTDAQLSLLLMSSSANEGDNNNSGGALLGATQKLTPSSPVHSPRYSLLVGGDTSSENSSALNTPQYDLDPLMVASAMSGMSGLSGTSSMMQQQQALLLGVSGCGGGDGESSYLGTSRESLGSNFTTHSHPAHGGGGGGSSNNNHSSGADSLATSTSTERRDMNALKRELSLDLQPIGMMMMSTSSGGGGGAGVRMLIDHVDAGVGGGGGVGAAGAAGQGTTGLGVGGGGGQLKQHQQLGSQLISPSNNSNFTDNTSQSATPSEFGYQHLQRHSSMHSLLESDYAASGCDGEGHEHDEAEEEDDQSTPSNCLADGHHYHNLPRQLQRLESPSQVYEPLQRNSRGGISEADRKLNSPIKATISITYNMRSPQREQPPSAIDQQRISPAPTTTTTAMGRTKAPLLETSFDENVVYEQVKFFRNSVTEVNQMLSGERRQQPMDHQLDALHEEVEQRQEHDAGSSGGLQLVATPESDILMSETVGRGVPVRRVRGRRHHIDVEDILLGDDEANNPDDNADEAEHKSLYENVEMRKPHSVYMNILGAEMKGPSSNTQSELLSPASPSPPPPPLSSPPQESPKAVKRQEEEEDNDPPSAPSPTGSSARKSPSNFSVKELANKFESSPVEQLPAFDFSVRSSIKKPTAGLTFAAATASSSSSPPPTTTTSHIGSEGKASLEDDIARSLDENAFIREFGVNSLQAIAARGERQPTAHEGVEVPVAGNSPSNGSSLNQQQQPQPTGRRKSFDFLRPKTLNPPKRLPGMPIAEEQHQQQAAAGAHHYNNGYAPPPPHACDALLANEVIHGGGGEENDCETSEVRITPTTENRISLIQHNNTTTAAAATTAIIATPAIGMSSSSSTADMSNSNVCGGSGGGATPTAASNTNSLKMLSGVKLDRERIDRIKEERRQQLTQKYRGSTSDCSLVGGGGGGHTPTTPSGGGAGAGSIAGRSKSKTDLDSVGLLAEAAGCGGSPALRIKSKSRADMRTLAKDHDDNHLPSVAHLEFGGGGRAGSMASALNATAVGDSSVGMMAAYNGGPPSRVRSISDEKNQNGGDSVFGVPASVTMTTTAAAPSATARATAQLFERKTNALAVGGGGAGLRRSVGVTGVAVVGAGGGGASVATVMSGDASSTLSNSQSILSASRHSLNSTREKISPQFSIRDVTAMFESRSQK